MPTIRELFNNKQLSERGGKTAKEAFAIRDSKNINQAVANPLITYTGLLARKGAIKGAQSLPILDTRKRESLVEQTLTGANVIRLGSLPVIYGTDLPRLTLRTTPMLDTMKERTLGPISSDSQEQGGGGIGKTISNVRDKTKTILGIPTPITPSFVEKQFSEDIALQSGIKRPQFRKNQLDIIKQNASGVPANKLLGWIGENVSGGTPSQIGRNAIGGALRAGKEKFRQVAFGTNQEVPNGKKLIGFGIEGKYTKYDWTLTVTGFLPESFQNRNSWGVNYGALDGSEAIPQVKPNYDVEEGGLSSQLDKKGSTYSNLKNINPLADPGERNDLSDKQVIALTDGEDDEFYRNLRLSLSPERQKKFSSKQKDRPSLLRDISKNEFIENARGINSIGDVLNSIGPYDDTVPPTVLDDKSLEDVALVPFKIKSKITNRAVNFRTVIEGDITENITPGFGENRFVGSPFNFYTYESIERGVNFNFLIYALNAKEHKVNWEKLSFLTSLVYPQGYDEETTAVIPPIVEFTLGDLYKDKVAIINDIGYVYKNDGGWQINPNPKDSSFQERIAEIQLSENSPSYKVPKNDTEPMGGFVLPRLIDVSISFKFIESRINTQRKKLYSFGPQN